jgi:hypothetical protein
MLISYSFEDQHGIPSSASMIIINAINALLYSFKQYSL